jgi:acetylornithine/succinyldiaminopimelate/putrescine aminotransferase
MSFPEDPELRWRGLAIAVDVGDEKYAERVAKKCRARGLLLDQQENVLLMLPALNIDRATAKTAWTSSRHASELLRTSRREWDLCHRTER